MFYNLYYILTTNHIFLFFISINSLSRPNKQVKRKTYIQYTKKTLYNEGKKNKKEKYFM